MPNLFEDHLPLAALDIVGTGEMGTGSLTISAQARSVKFTDAVAAPATPNAWCYIRSGSPQERRDSLENYLGPVLNVWGGEPLSVTWINKLGSAPAERPGAARMLDAPPIEPLPMNLSATIPQFLSMNASIGVVTHLHGGKVKPDSDGWPLEPVSFECNPFGLPTRRRYHYPNKQRAALLWFHDHGMDNTAPQVHAGLAGLYFIRDQSDVELFDLIGDGSFELPLVIQDRVLNAARDAVSYVSGIKFAGGGFDRPEFLGDTLFVNGRPSPHAHVVPAVYRLRLLNGSNARSYALTVADPDGTVGGNIWYGNLLTAIGNEAGLFAEPKTLAPNDYLLLAPGERLDVLLDLTGLDPKFTKSLVLTNLAIQGALDSTVATPEPIFQTDEKSVVAPADAKDRKALFPKLSVANLLQFRLLAPSDAHAGHGMAPPPPIAADWKTTLGKILKRHADDESFVWDAADRRLKPVGGATPVVNRFVLLMNDTAGNKPNLNPITNTPWRDTQIWELAPSTDPNAANSFVVPFDAKLAAAVGAQGAPADGGVRYAVLRALFFEPKIGNPPQPATVDPLWPLAIDNVNPAGFPPLYQYPPLFPEAATIKPTEGTYEYWYVANIGNHDPLQVAETDGTIPDMHPFHMHLVNFVVTRRFVLQDDPANPGKVVFRPLDHAANPRRELDFDMKARHDTVRVQSNELVELLVHFPKGYTGKYPYHCHLVEHEDMGMMLHFDVQPASKGVA